MVSCFGEQKVTSANENYSKIFIGLSTFENKKNEN